ncbi:hypothetical protein OC835_002751 [Tilletia horrida]|uniref:Uncharacterized protein n=1 Tax=Tilletia horrida TaxID=155126 RepID=A0AAN6G585_9BASI|nr:hypothetical protein OC842_006773 [Tilletia horrida]KAK0534214.1 hypothetical protein OC835_002751 [Tilletia horrida]KAK0556354.1 hypothetical protein OC844_005870 [Tilletia horrida]
MCKVIIWVLNCPTCDELIREYSRERVDCDDDDCSIVTQEEFQQDDDKKCDDCEKKEE